MYKSIARYYDEIFPFNQTIFSFLDKHLPNGHILDIACGTATYAQALHSKYRLLSASDLDPEMIEIARKKSTKNISLQVQDMRDISSKQFVDGIYIIGNSLVHVSSIEEITTILKNCKNILKDHGTLIIQIINYDRILKNHITALPNIKTDNLTFYREYSYNNSPFVTFNTILKVDKKTIKNSINLYPLTKEELERILQDLGYINIKWFGSYDGNEYNKDLSYHTIVVCQKGTPKL